MSDFGFDGMMALKISKLIGNTKDGTAGDTANEKDTLMGRTHKIYNAIENIQTSSGDSGVILLIDFLLSDDNDRVEWAFQQWNIGKALDSMGNFGSDALAQCHSVNDIASNATLIGMIGKNETITSVCAKNKTLRDKLVDYLSAEDLLYYGYGYSKFNIGDVLTLKHYGREREFRVVAKDHFTTGKIVLFPEYIEETMVWSDLNTNQYSASTIREYLNTNILAGFSNKIQSSITTPAIPCHNKDVAIICRDKIWPLSTVEVGFGTSVQYAPNEGKAMPWFNSNERRIRKMYDANGAAQYWWLRTPYTNNTSNAWIVRNSGNSNYSGVTSGSGVAFALEI